MDGIQHNDPRPFADIQRFKGPIGDFGDGEDPLRGLGLRRAGEFERGNLDDFCARGPKRAYECGATRGVGQLWSRQDASNSEAGAHQLLDSADPFGGEEMLALARLATAKVES